MTQLILVFISLTIISFAQTSSSSLSLFHWQGNASRVQPSTENSPTLISDSFLLRYSEPSVQANCCTGNPIPINDNYANATALILGNPFIAGYTCNSTTQGGEVFGCATTNPNQSVWYKVTASASTTYISIDYINGNCFGSSAIWPSGILPNSNCSLINCQNADFGPNSTRYSLATIIGTTYFIQISYSTIGCGTGWCFNILATNTNPGAITNAAYPTVCGIATAGCYFIFPPTIPQVTTICTSYPLTGSQNIVNSGLFSFTTAGTSSQVSIGDVITSTCGGGNVDWFMWKLYNSSCNLINCGSIANLTINGVGCSQQYFLQISWEQVNCTYTNHFPFLNIPTGAPPCSALPIELINFSGQSCYQYNLLRWVTATETNNDFFTLERSMDGLQFENIGNVKGAGNSTQTLSYSLKDTSPIPGTDYYRLKQTDFDGHFKNSDIIAVETKGVTSFKIYPNPTNSNIFIYIEGSVGEGSEVEIKNSLGQILISLYVNNNQETELNTSIYNKGIYFIEVISNNTSFVKQLLKD